MKKVTVIFCALVVFYSQFILAKVQYDITDPSIAATMGDLVLSANTIEIFWHSYNHPNRPITPPQAMQKIIDDALLAQHARRTLPNDVLNSTNKVGFANDVMQQDRATALIRKTYGKELITEVKNLHQGIGSLYRFNNEITADKLAELMTLKSALMIEANPEQQTAAQKTIVATLNFSPAKLTTSAQQLTLWDIYRRQNVQGRLAIHKADLNYLRGQVKQHVGALMVLAWTKKNIPTTDYAAIKEILLNEQHKIRLLESMGLHADVHDDNPALREYAKNISEEKIKHFYQPTKMNSLLLSELRPATFASLVKNLPTKLSLKLKQD